MTSEASASIERIAPPSGHLKIVKGINVRYRITNIETHMFSLYRAVKRKSQLLDSRRSQGLHDEVFFNDRGVFWGLDAACGDKRCFFSFDSRPPADLLIAKSDDMGNLIPRIE